MHEDAFCFMGIRGVTWDEKDRVLISHGIRERPRVERAADVRNRQVCRQPNRRAFGVSGGDERSIRTELR